MRKSWRKYVQGGIDAAEGYANGRGVCLARLVVSAGLRLFPGFVFWKLDSLRGVIGYGWKGACA